MTSDEKPKIRKVWLPTEMKEAVAELCWKRRTKPSPYIAGLIQGFLNAPNQYGGRAIPPAGKDYASVYIHDSLWTAGAERAEQIGVTLSAVVRVAIAVDLEAEGIPWDVTTARPKNEHIPMRE